MSAQIRMEDFNYELPEARIAQEAVEPRDSSKLLVARGDSIHDHVFSDLSSLLPENSLMFFNNAKVIPARIFVKNSNGARIEIFLLQPFQADYSSAVNAVGYTEWICLVGNKKKWKPEEILSASVGNITLNIKLLSSEAVSFSWKSQDAFIYILEQLGAMPLPPYIKHAADQHDKQRYQTVYSSIPGSVAAPTAGLHFTEKVLDSIRQKGIETVYGTLHVSAGTFLPVKTEHAEQHLMHKEIFSVDLDTLMQLQQKCDHIIAVGTTSCRILESLYWCAVNLANNRADPFVVSQFVYTETYDKQVGIHEALDILIAYCRGQQLTQIQGETSIMIMPGYRFRYVKGLITNFHQPKSTLLLLISAFIGENWKKIYEHALAHEYRFLSYGDSSFLMP
jgi:S-adenosylmethionine:tRNA ribosyltransferase-isomerase